MVHTAFAGYLVHLLVATNWALSFLAAHLKIRLQFCDSWCPCIKCAAVLRSVILGTENTGFSPESRQGEELQNEVIKILHLVSTKYTAFHGAPEMAEMPQEKPAHRDCVRLPK